MEGTQKTSTPLPSQPCAVYRHLHCIVCKEALMNFIIIWQLTVTRLSFIRTLLYQPRRHEISPNIATKFLKRRLAFPTRKRLDLIQTSGLAIAVHSCLSNNMNDGRLQSASELAFQAAANWLPWTDCKHYSWYDLYQWLYPAMNSFHRYFPVCVPGNNLTFYHVALTGSGTAVGLTHVNSRSPRCSWICIQQPHCCTPTAVPVAYWPFLFTLRRQFNLLPSSVIMDKNAHNDAWGLMGLVNERSDCTWDASS